MGTNLSGIEDDSKDEVDSGYGFSEMYKVNPMINLFYNFPFNNKKYPKFIIINIYFFSLSYYILHILSYAYYGLLFDDTIHFMSITNHYHIYFIALCPLLMLIMRSIYYQLDKSLINLKSIVKDEADFNNKIIKWKKMISSPKQNYLVAVFLIITISDVIYNGIIFWKDPTFYNSLYDYPLNLCNHLLLYIPGMIIVAGFTWHLISIVRIIRDFCTLKLDLQPLHPDGAAGLKPLTNITFRMNLILLTVAGFPVWYALFTLTSPFDSTLILVMTGLTSMSIIVFIFPLLKSHKIMLDKKSETLQKLSIKYQEANEIFEGSLEKEGLFLHKEASETMDQLQKKYDQVKKMPLWPFNLNYFLRIIATIGLPIVLFFGEVILQVVIRNIF